MKRFFLSGMVLAAGLIASAAGTAEAQAGRVAFVNSQRIIAQAPGTADVERTLQGEMEKFRTELGQLETQLDSLQTAFERQQATLSATARQQRQQELQQRFTAYQQRRSELEQTAQQRQQELIAPIMKRISETIEAVRAEGSYAIIFDAANASMAAADPALDLTERVLERLKAAAPAGK